MPTYKILFLYACVCIVSAALLSTGVAGLSTWPGLTVVISSAAASLCALLTLPRWNRRWLHPIGLAGGIVVALSSAIFFGRSAEPTLEQQWRQRPPIAALIAEHNAGLPEGFVTRIDPGTTSTGFDSRPNSMYSLILLGMLLVKALDCRGNSGGDRQRTPEDAVAIRC